MSTQLKFQDQMVSNCYIIHALGTIMPGVYMTLSAKSGPWSQQLGSDGWCDKAL